MIKNNTISAVNTVHTVRKLSNTYAGVNAEVESIENSRGQFMYALTIYINDILKVDRHFNSRQTAIDYAYGYIEGYVDGRNGI